jgi:hypothetical protein
MRISEMRSREDADRILAETLATGWSDQFGVAVAVSLDPDAAGQAFLHQPLLGAYFTARPSRSVRRFLRDFFRFTPVRSRRAAQWVLGTAITTSVGLRLASAAALKVTPPLPAADEWVVLPGNQRIRTFDFATGTSRVFLKKGFSPAAFRNELAVRGGGATGPFPAIVRQCAAGSWFEEPIFDGFALPRCPPWCDVRRLEAMAHEALEAWSSPTARTASAAGYAGECLASLEAAVPALPGGGDWSDLARIGEGLCARAAELGSVELARGHGDFQPGNVLVARDAREVTLIDWEHAGERSRSYDRMVYALRTRSDSGLSGRLLRYVRGEAFANLAPPPDARERSARLALFLLEDLLWYATESLAGPYRAASQGLHGYRRELSVFGPGLDRLWLGRC